MRGKRSAPEKAAKHEAKGDTLRQKGKLDKALKYYQKALDLDPHRPQLLEKMIETKDATEGEWRVEDFAQSLSWTMQQQEEEHPILKTVHAKLTPEWKAATELSLKIISNPQDESRADDIEKLVAMGEIATRALLDLFVNLIHRNEEEDV